MLTAFAEIDYEKGCFKAGIENETTGETFYLPGSHGNIADAHVAARGMIADARGDVETLRGFLTVRKHETLH